MAYLLLAFIQNIGPFWLLILLVFVGGVLASIVVVIVLASGARHRKPEPSMARELRELQALLDDGLVTREEFERKRAEILGEERRGLRLKRWLVDSG